MGGVAGQKVFSRRTAYPPFTCHPPGAEGRDGRGGVAVSECDTGRVVSQEELDGLLADEIRHVGVLADQLARDPGSRDAVIALLLAKRELEDVRADTARRASISRIGQRLMPAASAARPAADGTQPMQRVRSPRGSHGKRRLRLIEGGATGSVAGTGAVLALGGFRRHALRTMVTAALTVPTAAAVAGGAYYLTPSETRLPVSAPAAAPSQAAPGVVTLPVAVVPAPKGRHHRQPSPKVTVTQPPAGQSPAPDPAPAHAAVPLPPAPLYLSTTEVTLNAGSGELTLSAGTGRAVPWSAESGDGNLVLGRSSGILSGGQEITVDLRLVRPDAQGWATVTVTWDGQPVPVRVSWQPGSAPAAPPSGMPSPGAGF